MKAIYSALILVGLGTVGIAQTVENDDMYFTSKDRVKAKSNVVSVSRTPVQGEKKEAPTLASESEVALNPTDSYSARNVNPEYAANSNTKEVANNADYFIEDYRPTGLNGNLSGDYSANSKKSYTNYSNNPYGYSPYSSFGSMGWGMGGMSPYGMSPYRMDQFGYPYSPYGGGMSMSYGMRFGSPWMYDPWMFGGGMGYGYAGYYSPYSTMYEPFMMSNMYCPYSFYGYNSSPYNYYPGTTYYSGAVVDNNLGGRNVAYGRRSERSSSEQFEPTDSRLDVTQSRTGRTLSSGRTRSTEGVEEYYERGWKNNRNNSNTAQTRSHWSDQNQASGNSSSTSPSTGRWNNSGRSTDGSSWNTWDSNSNNSNGTNWNSGGNTRSSWSGSSPSYGGSGGTRSSSGGGGGGGTRGRD